MRTVTILTAGMLLLTLLLTALAAPAAAHASKKSDDGKIEITWGWTNEPALTKTANGLDFIVRYAENGTGVTGVAADDLTVTLKYGSQTHVFEALEPQHGREAEGRYTGIHPVTPSEPGLYTLDVAGTIAGSPVSVSIPARHEVVALESSYFPPATDETPSGGDTSALEARIAALEQKVAALEAEAKTQSETPATLTPQPTAGGANDNATPALGVLALLGAVALAVGLRRRGA